MDSTSRRSTKWRTMALDCVFMTRKDWVDFAAILSAEFSMLRYLDRDHWRAHLDRAAMARREERIRRRGEVPDYRAIMRKPPRSAPSLLREFPAAHLAATMAWPLPEGWRAQWSSPDADGIRHVVNGPDGYVEIANSANVESAASYAGDGRRRHRLDRSSFRGYWREGNDEAGRFVARAFRLLNRETTRLFLWLDPSTLRPTHETPQPAPHFRGGRDASAWVAGSSNYYCATYVRPVWVGKPDHQAPKPSPG